MDFMAIHDALSRRRNEPGAITNVAKNFNVSRGRISRHVPPTLDVVTNILP